jgi:hypothetical protein
MTMHATRYALMASLFTLVACGDDGGSTEIDAGTGDAGGDAGPGAQDGAVDATAPDAGPVTPVYGLNIHPRGQTGARQAAFLHTIQSLSREVFDNANGMEFSSGVSTQSDGTSLYISPWERNELQRLDVNRAGELVEGPRFLTDSLANRVTNLYFVSETKAYGFVVGTEELVTFDPSEMLLSGGSVDLSQLLEDEQRSLGLRPGGILRDGLLYVAYVENDFPSSIRTGVTVAVIDPERDEVVDVLTDDRCNVAWTMAQVENGDILVAGTNWDNLMLGVSDALPSSCLLRIPAGEQRFDPDYRIDIDAMLGDRPGAGFMYAGDGNAYFLALEAEPDRTPSGLWSEPVHGVWLADLETEEASKVDGLSLTALRLLRARVDGRWFINIGSGLDEGTVWELDPEGGAPTERFDVGGTLVFFDRLR